MLETIVQKFRGIVLFAVVFLLSAVFVLQFGGPQAEGCSGGGTANVAAEVYDTTISKSDFKAAYLLSGGDNYPPELVKQYKLEDMVLYGLIERALLAREARKLGNEVTEEQVLERVAEDGLVYLSMSVEAGPYLPSSGPQRVDFSDSDGTFSKQNLKNFIQYRLHRSIRDFTESQIEEVLAHRMREAVAANVTVAPGEVLDAYVREKESVTLDYLRFSKVYYEQQLSPSEQDIQAFMREHQADVDAEYEAQKHRYTALEKQVRARHILIKVPSGASEEVKQAAREKIEGLLERARAGEDFARLAREYSEDTGSAKKGGDLGYNPRGRMVKPFDEAQFSLEVGQISDVVESTFGFHIIKVEGIREGDVPVDEAKREIAEKLYRDRKASELAKQAAEQALEKLQAGAEMSQVADQLAASAPQPASSRKADAGEGQEATEPPAADPLAPQVRQTRPFGRTGSAIPGPFDSTPLVKAAYELTEEAPLGNQVMQLGDDYFVYKLAERTVADESELTDDERRRIADGLLRRKQHEAVTAYVRELKAEAQRADAVFVDTSLLATPNS